MLTRWNCQCLIVKSVLAFKDKALDLLERLEARVFIYTLWTLTELLDYIHVCGLCLYVEQMEEGGS